MLIEDYWNSITPDTVNEININFKSRSKELVGFFVDRITKAKTFEINTFNEGRETGAGINYHDEAGMKGLELRTKGNGGYELVLTVRGPHTLFVYKHGLSQEEVELVPANKLRAMEKVKELGQSVTFYNP